MNAPLMTIALAGYVFDLFRTLLGGVRPAGAEAATLPTLSWSHVSLAGQAVWLGPVSVAILIAGMYVFTVLGFELMQSLPILVIEEYGGH